MHVDWLKCGKFSISLKPEASSRKARFHLAVNSSEWGLLTSATVRQMLGKGQGIWFIKYQYKNKQNRMISIPTTDQGNRKVWVYEILSSNF